MNKTLLTITGVAITLVIVALLTTNDAPSSTSEDVSSTPSQHTHTPSFVDSPAVIAHQNLQDTSIRDTQVDVPANADALWLTADLVFYFDYFLMLRGETTMAQIRTSLAEDARNRFSPGIANKVINLFDRYINYQEQLAANLKSTDPISLDELRGDYFTQREIVALFEEYQAKLNRPTKAAAFHQDYQAFRDTVKNQPDQLMAEATERFGEAAATRLAALQQQRAIWQQRIEQFQYQYRSIERANGISEVDKDQAIQALLNDMFTEQEQKRVLAILKLSANT